MARRRSRYKTPGWERQPVFWSYSVAFKKPRSGRLVWIGTKSQDVQEASRDASRSLEQYGDHEDYREYGISTSYWRHWGGYDEEITRDEYEFALARERALEYLKGARGSWPERWKSAHAHARRDGFRTPEDVWESASWDARPF